MAYQHTRWENRDSVRKWNMFFISTHIYFIIRTKVFIWLSLSLHLSNQFCWINLLMNIYHKHIGVYIIKFCYTFAKQFKMKCRTLIREILITLCVHWTIWMFRCVSVLKLYVTAVNHFAFFNLLARYAFPVINAILLLLINWFVCLPLSNVKLLLPLYLTVSRDKGFKCVVC